MEFGARRIVVPEFVMSSNWLPYTVLRPFVTSIRNGDW